MEHRKIETSAEVYAVIRARHGADMVTHGTYTDTGEDRHGFGEAYTEWGFKNADFPIIAVRTTWEYGERRERLNQKNEYWLCVGEVDRENS